MHVVWGRSAPPAVAHLAENAPIIQIFSWFMVLWWYLSAFQYHILNKKKKKTFVRLALGLFSVFSLFHFPLVTLHCSFAQIAQLAFPDWEKALFRK